MAITRVVDSRRVSTIRNLLARRELPVSVSSTIASARVGGLTSVAPQENSTVAVIFFFLRYLFYSVDFL